MQPVSAIPTSILGKTKALFQLMRPAQWIKNGFVLMPLIFSGQLTDMEDVVASMGMFVAFCLISSATYILNDYCDMERDRAHPLKRLRPLAAGTVSTKSALFAMVVLALAAFAVGAVLQVPLICHGLLGLYVVIQLAYSFSLKNVVILDVLAISTGFLLRVLTGTIVIQEEFSSWLLLCTFAVAILLALGKRRHEVVMLCNDAVCHRPVLENYSVFLLDQLLQVVTASTFIFYCLYSVRGNPESGIEAEEMMFTIPLVTYGIFRYMYLVYHREEGGSPTALLLTDPPLLICAIIWLIACIVIIYT